jgi:hypothetical protein
MVVRKIARDSLNEDRELLRLLQSAGAHGLEGRKQHILGKIARGFAVARPARQQGRYRRVEQADQILFRRRIPGAHASREQFLI